MYSALTLVAFVATTLAVAVEESEFTLKVLLKRQENTSGAKYQCHSDCGYTILDASADNCNNSTWTDLLEGCEECANTYDILPYYGDQVGAAAKDCGITVNFSPSAGASSESTASETSAAASSTISSSSDAVSSASETAAPTEAATTASAETASDTAAATSTSQTATASSTIVPSSSSNSTNATQSASPTGTEEFTGAGSRLGSQIGTAAFAACVFAAVML